MTRSTIRLVLLTTIALGGFALLAAERSSKATQVAASQLVDEDETGLFSGAVSYERADKTIAICNGC
jgi:hypothetical protein